MCLLCACNSCPDDGGELMLSLGACLWVQLSLKLKGNAGTQDVHLKMSWKCGSRADGCFLSLCDVSSVADAPSLAAHLVFVTLASTLWTNAGYKSSNGLLALSDDLTSASLVKHVCSYRSQICNELSSWSVHTVSFLCWALWLWAQQRSGEQFCLRWIWIWCNYSLHDKTWLFVGDVSMFSSQLTEWMKH